MSVTLPREFRQVANGLGTHQANAERTRKRRATKLKIAARVRSKLKKPDEAGFSENAVADFGGPLAAANLRTANPDFLRFASAV